MNFYLINGSNRKKYNTAKLLDSAAEGITDKLDQEDLTSKITILNLYDLNYTGCKSCLHCKKIDGKYYGQCPIKDDLHDYLPRFWNCDGLIIGSPIYFGNVSGQTRCFLERLMFPKLVYGGKSLAKPKSVGMIYTMNVNKEIGEELYTDSVFNSIENSLKYHFGKVYSLKSYDTYQFKDYSLYENYMFDEKLKAKEKEEQFPKDLESAYNLGEQLVIDTIQKG